MRFKKSLTLLLNGILILIVILFLLDTLTAFGIKSSSLKSFTYFGLIFLVPITLVWNLLIIEAKKRKVLSAILPFTALIGILIIGPTRIVFASSPWKTQTIQYQNRHIRCKKIEFQMQDMGALGYNRRTVEVTYLTNLFMIVKPVQKNIDQRVEWVRVDKKINEIGLKP